MNAPPMVEVTDQTDTLEIAMEELKQKKVLEYYVYTIYLMSRFLLSSADSFLMASMKIGSWRSWTLIKSFMYCNLFIVAGNTDDSRMRT